MCRICPNCGSIAEYDAYYGTVVCTRCNWESEKLESTSEKYLGKTKNQKDYNIKEIKEAKVG